LQHTGVGGPGQPPGRLLPKPRAGSSQCVLLISLGGTAPLAEAGDKKQAVHKMQNLCITSWK